MVFEKGCTALPTAPENFQVRFQIEGAARPIVVIGVLDCTEPAVTSVLKGPGYMDFRYFLMVFEKGCTALPRAHENFIKRFPIVCTALPVVVFWVLGCTEPSVTAVLKGTGYICLRYFLIVFGKGSTALPTAPKKFQVRYKIEVTARPMVVISVLDCTVPSVTAVLKGPGFISQEVINYVYCFACSSDCITRLY